MPTFIPKKYWNQTHSQYQGLQAVGYVALGYPFNIWMYRLRERVFLRVLTKLKIKKTISILDIGSGVGFYPKLFKKWRFRNITASDFSSEAIQTLKKIRAIKVKKIDIGVEQPLSSSYDVVTCFDMLYHIVDDKAYRRAFTNLAQLTKKGGLLILSENFLPDYEYRGVHQVCRSEKTIMNLLKKNGFKLVHRQPVFFLMNTPISSRNKIHSFFWKGIRVIIGKFHFVGYILGPVLYPFDLCFSRIYHRGPSTEYIVAQKLK